MKNINNWKPTKFKIIKNVLKPSESISISSRLMASFIAKFYTETIPNYSKGDLLDLGCGNVPLYEFYKDKVNTITCADWENSAYGKSHIDVYCDLNKGLPFRNNCFDTIIMSDVLEHLSEPFFTLGEIKRILKPNGILLMNYPFMYGLHEVPHDYCRYTNFRIRTWVEKLEMKIILEKKYGGLLELWEHATIRILKKFPLGNLSAKFFAACLFLLKKILFIKNRINTDNNHPYMYGFVISKKNNQLLHEEVSSNQY